MGNFLVVEGGSACGKTTFLMRFTDEYKEWHVLREPGGTGFGERERDALQSLEKYPVGARASVLGYNAARAQLIEERIAPGLSDGENIVLDRFWPSTFAYQGADGANLEDLKMVCRFATGGLEPIAYLFFDLDPIIARERNRKKVDLDRHDIKPIEFHYRVRRLYEILGQEMGDKWITIDASGTKEEVFAQATGILRRRNLIK